MIELIDRRSSLIENLIYNSFLDNSNEFKINKFRIFFRLIICICYLFNTKFVFKYNQKFVIVRVNYLCMYVRDTKNINIALFQNSY